MVRSTCWVSETHAHDAHKVVAAGTVSDELPEFYPRLMQLLERGGDAAAFQPMLISFTHRSFLELIKSALRHDPTLGVELKGTPLFRRGWVLRALMGTAHPSGAPSRSLSHLLQPSDFVLSLLGPMYADLRTHFVVGVQIRVEYLAFGQDELFFRCFEEVSENLQLTAGRPTKMFLTTDSDEVGDAWGYWWLGGSSREWLAGGHQLPRAARRSPSVPRQDRGTHGGGRQH